MADKDDRVFIDTNPEDDRPAVEKVIADVGLKLKDKLDFTAEDVKEAVHKGIRGLQGEFEDFAEVVKETAEEIKTKAETARVSYIPDFNKPAEDANPEQEVQAAAPAFAEDNADLTAEKAETVIHKGIKLVNTLWGDDK